MSIWCSVRLFFFFKQKTAYEMRISDWSSDVCSSDLHRRKPRRGRQADAGRDGQGVQRTLGQAHAAFGGEGPQSGDDARLDRRKGNRRCSRAPHGDRKSVGEGKRVSGRVDLWGARINNKKKRK